MTSDTHLTGHSKVGAIKAQLEERRNRAHNNFEIFRETVEATPSFIPRNAALQAVLERINIGHVVYGEAKHVHASGLPEGLMGKRELA